MKKKEIGAQTTKGLKCTFGQRYDAWEQSVFIAHRGLSFTTITETSFTKQTPAAYRSLTPDHLGGSKTFIKHSHLLKSKGRAFSAENQGKK